MPSLKEPRNLRARVRAVESSIQNISENMLKVLKISEVINSQLISVLGTVSLLKERVGVSDEEAKEATKNLINEYKKVAEDGNIQSKIAGAIEASSRNS